MRISSKGLLTLPQTLGGQESWPHRSGQGRTLTAQGHRGSPLCRNVLAQEPSAGSGELPGRAVLLWHTRRFPRTARPSYRGSSPCQDVLVQEPSGGSGAVPERVVLVRRARPD